jgi:hypothetical protein
VKTKLALITITAFLVFFLLGCGVSQSEYDALSDQLRASQAQAAELQSSIKGLLIIAQSKITELEGQVSVLKQQYEIIGETPVETAENIVKSYHETHIYSEYDFFVCSDMALDVWDMLKAHGINALIKIGNVETGAENITAASHAWVLAETTPGEYLALETTAGHAVWKEDNPLYYKGWSFDNPREYKRFVELKQEYNVRVDISNGLVNRVQTLFSEYEKELTRYQELLDEFNTKYAGHSVSLEAFDFKDRIETQLAIMKEIEGRCNQLTDLIKKHTQELENIISEMNGLLS